MTWSEVFSSISVTLYENLIEWLVLCFLDSKLEALDSKLETRSSKLEARFSKLNADARDSRLDARSFRGSRIEFRVTVNLHLTGTVGTILIL